MRGGAVVDGVGATRVFVFLFSFSFFEPPKDCNVCGLLWVGRER